MFKVSFLSGCTYHFSVSSKAVGFLVHRLCFVKCDLFDIHFTLWGTGGPNFLHEHQSWLLEEESMWSIAGSKKFKNPLRTP